ncbi:MAG: transposase [Clostridia bacterium]|nr:transposase [Clostridia bacterium]
MPKSRPPYPPQFRAEAVKLVQTSGKSLREISADLGVSIESLRNWVKQTDIDQGQRDGLTTSEREELRRLRRENRILQEEREILRTAVAFFASETIPTR